MIWKGDNSIEINKIYNQDCIEFMKTLPSECVDLIFSDPPFNLEKDYGVDKDKRDNYYEWCAEWIKEAWRILKPTGSFYLMTTQDHLQEMLFEMKKHGIQQNIIIWKNTSMPIKKKYSIAYQPILYFTKSKKYTYKHDADGQNTESAMPWGRKPKGFTMKDLWEDISFVPGGCMASKEAILFPGTKRKYHKCQMPLKLAQRIILASTIENDLTYDMFSGSGTFIVKAKELNRNYIATELNEEYINEIIIPRLENDNIKS